MHGFHRSLSYLSYKDQIHPLLIGTIVATLGLGPQQQRTRVP